MKVTDFLLQRGIASNDIIQRAQTACAQETTFIERLFDQPAVNESNLLNGLAEFFSIPKIDVSSVELDPSALKLFSIEYMKKVKILPLSIDTDNSLTVAVCDPLNVCLADDLGALSNRHIKRLLATKKQILNRLENHFSDDQFNKSLHKVLEFSEKKTHFDDLQLNAESAILKAEQSPIVSLVNSIIVNAVKEECSDIHIEPREHAVELRYRHDGMLNLKMKLPKNIQRHLISRIKIMADLDISEWRRPQDGRIQIPVEDKRIDLRISIIPTVYGEKIVLRILNAAETQIGLERLGMKPEELGKFGHMISQPQGLLLVCGPTGSGKTSTLYAAIHAIMDKTKNIITIEDPVEFIIEGINQIQINEKLGLTFANGLRSVLRQDPDCVLVGEIRDLSTADMVYRASLTGHMVFSTLHTNCSLSAVTRLRNIGIDPFIIASSTLGIVSQRLLRMNCSQCSEEYFPSPVLIKKYKETLEKNDFGHVFYKGKGCKACNFSGYRSRTAVFEILTMSNNVRQLVVQNASELEIKKAAEKEGFQTLRDSAILKVAGGLTTLEEVERVLGNIDKMHEKETIEHSLESKIEEHFNDDDDLDLLMDFDQAAV